MLVTLGFTKDLIDILDQVCYKLLGYQSWSENGGNTPEKLKKLYGQWGRLFKSGTKQTVDVGFTVFWEIGREIDECQIIY